MTTKEDPFQGTCIVLYGPPKVGKTQTAASFPTPFFICTEPGHRYITAKKKRLTQQSGWVNFRNMLKVGTIETMKPKTVIIDSFGPLYSMCFDYVCRQKKIEHPEDTKHGKGWAAIRREFYTEIQKLSDQCEAVGATQVWVAHSRVQELRLDGKIEHKIEVDLPGQARQVALPVPDHVWYLGYMSEDGSDPLTNVTNNRRLWMHGTSVIEGGCRNPRQTTKIISNLPETGQYDFIVKRVLKELK